MVRKLDDHGVRMTLGPEAGSQARVALAFRALGVGMWVLSGLWAGVTLLHSLALGLGGDERQWLFTPGWWVWTSLALVWAVVGATGIRLFHVWERRALGDRYGELRLEPRPDPS